MKKLIPLLMLLPTLGLADNGWLSGGIFSMTQADIAQLLSMGQITTPTNPPSGFNALYFKSNNHLYMLDSSGNEVQVDGSDLWANQQLSNLVGPTAINADLLFNPDNTYDIGADGSSRPSSIHAADHITVPLIRARDNVPGSGQHDITVRGGNGITGNKDGGNLTLAAGLKSGTGTNGHIYLQANNINVIDINDGGVINVPILTASQLVATDASKNLVSLARGNLTEATSSVLTVTGGTNSVIGSGTTIEVKKSSTSQDGYLASTDFSTFSGKQDALVSGTNIKTVSGNSLLGSGDVGTIGLGYGGTGQTTANASFNALAPVQTSNGDKVLASNGTDTGWYYAGLGSGSFGTNNVIVGRAKPTNLSGTGQTIVGVGAGEALTSAVNNVAIGLNALASMTTNGAHVAVGTGAGQYATSTNNVLIGTNAGAGQSGTAMASNNTVAIGYLAGQYISGGGGQLAIGSQALQGTSTTSVSGGSNLAIGNFASQYVSTGTNNVAIGGSALGGQSGTPVTGSNNVTVGGSAGQYISTGSSNTIIGTSAMTGSAGSPITGSSNTVVGGQSGTNLVSGSSNVFLGLQSGLYSTTQSNELFIDNQDRTNYATQQTNSLIYGTFSATPSSQTLKLNAAVTATYGLTTTSIVHNGATSGTFTEQVPASITSYAVTWPSTQGAASTYLKNDGSGNLSWDTVSSGFTNPMTTAGDLIVGGVAGAATRLGIGSNNQVLKSNGTTAVWGSAPAPTPLVQTAVNLVDGANIAVDASLGNIFRVTLGGNRTLSNPTNASDGQILQFEIRQDGTGGRTLAFDTKFRFSNDLPSPSLSSAASKLDRLLFMYNSADDKFDLTAVNRGF